MKRVEEMLAYCRDQETDFWQSAADSEDSLEDLEIQLAEYDIIRAKWQTCYHLAIRFDYDMDDVLNFGVELNRVNQNREEILDNIMILKAKMR